MNRFQYSFSKSPPPASGGAPCLTYISRDQYDPEEWSSSLHTHGCAELFFITDGHGKFLTQNDAFPVALHDMVIVNAGVPHTELSQAESPLQYIVLGVEGLEAMAGSDGYAMLHLHTGWKELMACLHLMLQEVYDTLPGCEDACRHLLEVVLIRLERQRSYAVRCTLTARAMPPAQGEGVIQLRQTPCGTFTDTPPLRFPLERMACDCRTLSYAAVLYPQAGGVGTAELSLVLDTRNALCVERAVLDVVEL